MRLLRVHARDFGPLRDARLELAPGFNLLAGPNEAGKSSWLAALFAGLCGLRRGPGLRKEDREFAERHRPWSGGTWAVELDLELSDGQRLQLQQDFDDPAASRAIDLATGRDRTAEILRDGCLDGSVLLGMTRSTLPTTLLVRQAHLLEVLAHPQGLQEQLQRAATSGEADETAERALGRLRSFRAERVGLRRRGSTKPLQQTVERREAARQASDQAHRAHSAYLELVARREEAEAEVLTLGQRIAARRRGADARRLERLRTGLQRARELADRYGDDGPPDPVALQRRIDRLRSAMAAWASRPPEPPPFEGCSGEQLAAELAALPATPVGDLEPAIEVREAADAWRRAAREAEFLAKAESPALAAAAAQSGLSSAELRRLAERLEARPSSPDLDRARETSTLATRVARGRRGVWLLLGAATLLVVALLAGTSGPPQWQWAALAAIAVAIALAVVGFVIRAGLETARARLHEQEMDLAVRRDAVRQAEGERRTAAASATAAGLPADPAALRRLAAESEVAEAVDGQRGRFAEQAQRVRRAAERSATVLLAALAPRLGEVEEGADPGALMARYRAECRERRRQAALAARRGDLEQALGARREAEAAAERDRRLRKEAELRLRQAATAAAISGDGLETMAERLAATCERLAAEVEQLRRDREEWGVLQALLAGRSLAEVEQGMRRLESAVESAAGAPPAAGEEDGDLTELERRFDEERRRLDQLTGEVSAREHDLPDVAAAEEQVARAEEELERVGELERVLELAQRFLAEARDWVQRDIAPRLARSIVKRLPAVTGGRYREALVDPATMIVKVREEGGEWREVSRLSHGTAEQVYLLARIALAEHLAVTGEPAPLLLDEVTVHADAGRTAALLDLLHTVSRERQVVLCSQEIEVLAWGRQNLTGARDRMTELA